MIKNSGSISLSRKIQDHWIWEDPNKLKWWLDILLTVNYKKVEVILGYEVFTCERGESLMSISTWAARWNTSKDTARNFLDMLVRNNMISRVSIGKSTRITVCNYDSYQSPLHVNQSQSTRKPSETPTQLKKDNKENNNYMSDAPISAQTETKISINKLVDGFENRREEFRKSLYDFTKYLKNPNGAYSPDMVKDFFEYWSEPNKSKSKMKWELEKTWDLNLRLSKWANNSLTIKKITIKQPSYLTSSN